MSVIGAVSFEKCKNVKEKYYNTVHFSAFSYSYRVHTVVRCRNKNGHALQSRISVFTDVNITGVRFTTVLGRCQNCDNLKIILRHL